MNTLKQSLRLWVVCDVSSPSMVRRTRPLATIIIEHSGGSASSRATKTNKLQILQFHSGRLPIVSRKNKCIANRSFTSVADLHRGSALRVLPPPTNLTSECAAFTPPLSEKTYKELHHAEIATHNWRHNATSKAKISQRAQICSKDWRHDNQRVGMPGHHCLPSA